MKKTYEVYCESFSQIIYAGSLISACWKFAARNPDQIIIAAEDTEVKIPKKWAFKPRKWLLESAILWLLLTGIVTIIWVVLNSVS